MDSLDLSHITLSTGHVRQSPRSEVRQETIALLAPILRELVAGHVVDMPRVAGYTLVGSAGGDCLLVTVCAADGAPVVTIASARGPRQATHLWDFLHDTAETGGLDPLDPQTIRGAAPLVSRWCAARLELGLAAHPGAAGWLGDFERCVAWTWILRGREIEGPLRRPRIRVQRPIATPGRAHRTRRD